jgi:hypothetical protein
MSARLREQSAHLVNDIHTKKKVGYFNTLVSYFNGWMYAEKMNITRAGKERYIYDLKRWNTYAII